MSSLHRVVFAIYFYSSNTVANLSTASFLRSLFFILCFESPFLIFKKNIRVYIVIYSSDYFNCHDHPILVFLIKIEILGEYNKKNDVPASCSISNVDQLNIRLVTFFSYIKRHR